MPEADPTIALALVSPGNEIDQDPNTIIAAVADDGSCTSSGDEDGCMIQCDAPSCGKWYDCHLLFPPLNPLTATEYEVWHCEHCIPYHGPSVHRRRRAGLRKRRRIDFVKLNDPGVLMEHENGRNGVAADDVQDVDFAGMLKLRRSKGMFTSGRCGGGCLLKLATGVEFNAAYANKHGFDRPVMFANKKSTQLGMRLPKSDGDYGPFTFANVAELVGQFRTVQVIDTATQLTTEYTLREWVEYLETPSKERTRTLNVITLEFSQTPLGRLVTVPKFARDVDFVNLHWPKTMKDVDRTSLTTSDNKIEESAYMGGVLQRLERLKKEEPRVTKYCLMSAGGSYTDFHVDFGGTAVWYHVYSGSKVFYFIEPTTENLRIYSRWATNANISSGSKAKKYEFLPDLISAAGGKVYEVALRQSGTLFIPSGWIHAVYTPEDSLVFGGNFVHRHSLEMQLNIYRLEGQMRVGRDFRFPNYQKLMWYAASDFLEECDVLWTRRRQLKVKGGCDKNNTEERKAQVTCAKYSPHIIKGYRALAKELDRWSVSKVKHTIQQYPAGMNVARISNQLGELMKRCVAYTEEK